MAGRHETLGIFAGGRVRIVESEFETTGSSMDYEVCRMSQEPELLVYSDETMQVGFWRAAEVPSLPLSSANEPSFLTQDDFHTVRNEVCNVSWAMTVLYNSLRSFVHSTVCRALQRGVVATQKCRLHLAKEADWL